jgi:quinol monooxygenase YgiN
VIEKLFLILGALMLPLSFSGSALAEEQDQYVQMAELEIDPVYLEAYNAALREQIETAIRVEPGVLVLYAVAEKDNPTHIRVFEAYASMDAYRAHLQAEHFKKYKETTETMVRSLRLVRTIPLTLGSK